MALLRSTKKGEKIHNHYSCSRGTRKDQQKKPSKLGTLNSCTCPKKISLILRRAAAASDLGLENETLNRA